MADPHEASGQPASASSCRRDGGFAGPEPPGYVRVWRARLDDLRARMRDLWGMLSAEERARADRFRVSGDRERAIAARGLLRWLLARHLGADVSALEFTYGPRGKPALRHPTAVRFNVAHSGDVIVWAISPDHEVGVDVERIRRDLDWPPLAARYFGHRERAALAALAPARRDEGFFACWTRKEAYLKATGFGLGLALDSFAVSVDPDEPAALLRVDGDPGAASRWSLADVAVGPGYRACLAVPYRGLETICRDVAADHLP